MEAAGLALATLSIVATAYEKYAETLETIRLFRTNKYRRHLERYCTLLGAQQASLVNALEIVLGVEIKEEDTSGVLGPRGTTSIWTDHALQTRLQKTLGRDYAPFVKLMEDSTNILQDLDQKLEENVPTTTPGTRARAALEIQKAKNILSRKQFDHLFDTLDTSINLLQRLVDQSLQRQKMSSKNSSLRYQVARSPAASIYKAFLRENSWSCSCRDKHSVLLPVDSKFESPNMSGSIFRLVLATVKYPTDLIYSWQELEVEPSKTLAGSPSLMHMCSTIVGKVPPEGERKSIGSVLEGEYRHIVFITNNGIGTMASESLEDVLKSSSLAPWLPGFYFQKRVRLYLAVRLAWSVLHLHGNWLREHWRTRDIRFPWGPNTPDIFRPSFQQPFLSWNVCHERAPSSEVSPIISSPVLFPLALALIELSLCRPIDVLKTPEDESPEEAVSLLKTANRCLNAVYSESGERYGTVVRRCLHWSETKDTDPDDENFQACFYKLIASPLSDVMKAFDGN
ncbi:hypothetical protein BDV18DRAFT_80910 [Aspergillus unguis]